MSLCQWARTFVSARCHILRQLSGCVVAIQKFGLSSAARDWTAKYARPGVTHDSLRAMWAQKSDDILWRKMQAEDQQELLQAMSCTTTAQLEGQMFLHHFFFPH